MKILTVVYSLGKGGTERAAVNFALAYAKLGHDSRVLHTQKSGCRADALLQSNVSIYHSKQIDYQEEIRLWKPDIIHIHSHGLTYNCVKLLKEKFQPAEIWETNVFSSPSQWEALIDKSFQLSEWSQYLYAKRGGSSKKSFVIPNPINTDTFSRVSDAQINEFRASLGISKDSIVLGRIGQAFDGKWSGHLLSIFEKINLTRKNTFLLLVDPPMSIRERSAFSPCSDSIRILTPIEDDSTLKTVYSSIDIFTHIAEQGESFGMVLAEALLCETPVVTLATPWGDNSQAEVIGNGIGGFVSGSPNGFLEMTKVLVDNNCLRAEIGSRGRDFILDNYGSLRIAQMALASGRNVPIEANFSNANELYFVSNEAMVLARLALRFNKFRLLQYATAYKPWSAWIGKKLAFFNRQMHSLLSRIW